MSEQITTLSDEISITDLGREMNGEDTTPAVAEPAVPKVEATPETPVVPEPEAAPVPETPAAEPTEIPEPEEKPGEKKSEKPEKWWNERLSVVSREKREFKAQAREALTALDSEKARAERLQRELDAAKTAQPGPVSPAAPAAPSDGTSPELATYVAELKDGESYEVAVQRYTAASIKAALTSHEAIREKQQVEKVQAETQKTQQAQFTKDWRAALDTHPDFEDVVERVRASAPDGLQVAVSQLRNDDNTALWPEMTIYLDEHPEALTDLSDLFKVNPYAATIKLGRLAATLSPANPGTPKTAPVVPAPVVAKKALTKPPAVVGGTAAPSVLDLSEASLEELARELPKYGIVLGR